MPWSSLQTIFPEKNSHTCSDELAHVSTWAKSSNLKLNLVKSKEIIFRSKPSQKRTVQQPDLQQSLTRVSSITALGVVIDDKLSFTEHCIDNFEILRKKWTVRPQSLQSTGFTSIVVA